MMRRPNFSIIVIVGLLLGSHFSSGSAGAEDNQQQVTPEMTAVGELNEAYVTAFNSADVDKLSACLTAKCDFTLLTGATVSGRKQVAAAHAAFFQNNPGAKIEGKQLTYRTIRPKIVLASGTWKVTGGPAGYPPSGNWYTVVVQKEGRWQYEAMRLMIPVNER
jgi:uncharacterized protein (TIGR02246 family)